MPLQAVKGLPGFVGKPFFVERLVDSGVDPHDVVFFVVEGDVAAERVHDVN